MMSFALGTFSWASIPSKLVGIFLKTGPIFSPPFSVVHNPCYPFTSPRTVFISDAIGRLGPPTQSGQLLLSRVWLFVLLGLYSQPSRFRTWFIEPS